MVKYTATEAYKSTENDYVEGINSPHGRIALVFGLLIDNLDKLKEKHPKTDFIAFGKCMNSISILSQSLDMENGGALAQNLIELYDYSRRCLRAYLDTKDIHKLEEVQEIFENLNEGWEAIDPIKNKK